MLWENTSLNRGARAVLMHDHDKIVKAKKELERRKANLRKITNRQQRLAEQIEIENMEAVLKRSLANVEKAAAKI